MNALSRREKERLASEEDIINAAEKIFITMGYNGASMEQIAKEAQFTRKTIYQYFDDKEDLYYAVATRGFQQLISYFQDESQSNINGFESLRSLSKAYYRFFIDFPNTLTLINYAGYVKSKKLCSDKRIEFMKANELLVQEVTAAIDKGKVDGSIRSDIDTRIASYSAEFLITGFFHMLSVSGESFTTNSSLDMNEFIQFNINLLCAAFQASNNQNVPS